MAPDGEAAHSHRPPVCRRAATQPSAWTWGMGLTCLTDSARPVTANGWWLTDNLQRLVVNGQPPTVGG